MFLLRCTFFLSIVYLGISYGVGSSHSPRAFADAVARAPSDLPGFLAGRATDWCAERVAQCARDAARLTALVQTTSAALTRDVENDVIADEAPRAPMPIPDPRRRIVGDVLTDAR